MSEEAGSGQRSTPRVFVSSVIDGFHDYRQAAREGILAAGAHPVLVNEDFPSRTESSRNACLDAIESCDLYLMIVGARGGWRTPSGRLVVEEEYEYAVRRHRPVLAFLQDIDRDADASALARIVSDYVRGVFRRTFHTPAELTAEIARALSPLLGAIEDRSHVTDLQPYLSQPWAAGGEAMLRLVIAPERRDEVLDPTRLESPAFLRQLYAMAHVGDSPLFAYEQAKQAAVEAGILVITQSNPHGRHGDGNMARFALGGDGVLVLDGNVTGRERSDGINPMRGFAPMYEEDVTAVLGTGFAFAAKLWDVLDPYERYQRFAINFMLSHAGGRMLEPRAPRGNTMRMSLHRDESHVAFPEPRLLVRNTLASPSDEIARGLTLLKRIVNRA